MGQLAREVFSRRADLAFREHFPKRSNAARNSAKRAWAPSAGLPRAQCGRAANAPLHGPSGRAMRSTKFMMVEIDDVTRDTEETVPRQVRRGHPFGSAATAETTSIVVMLTISLLCARFRRSYGVGSGRSAARHEECSQGPTR